MSDVELPFEDYRLPIHFDVSSSRLPASDVVVTLRSATQILRGIEEAFVEYERPENRPVIYLTQVNQGSLSLVLVISGGVSGGVLGGIAGAIAGSAIGGLPVGIVGGTAGVVAGGMLGVSRAMTILDSDHYKRFCEGLTDEAYDPIRADRSLGKVVKGILSKPVDQIREVTPENISLDECLKAKSEFFKMLGENKDIEAIGFEDSREFPIKRNQFPLHIYTPKPLTSSFRTEYRAVIIEKAVVIDKDKKWNFIDKETEEALSAYMHDEEFKKDFLHKSQYPLKKTADNDEICARFEVEELEDRGLIQEKDWHLREVYVFNGESIKNKKATWLRLKALDEKRRMAMRDREVFRQALTEEQFRPLAELADKLFPAEKPQLQLFRSLYFYEKYGFRFEVSSNEIPPAYFHITRENKSTIYSIETGNFVRGDILKMEDQASIKAWYRKNCRLLVEEWNNRRPSDCPVDPIDPDTCGAS